MALPFFGPTIADSKGRLFEQIGYAPAPDPRARVVVDFHLDDSKYQIISAPARTSKSYAAAPEAVHDFFPELVRGEDGALYAARNETYVWLVGISYDTVKEWDYCWSYLIDTGILARFGGQIEQKANTPTQGNMVIKVRWPLKTESGQVARSILQVKSSVNERTLQGEQVRTCIMSEAAEHDERIFRKYLRTRCRRIIFPTTPKRKAIWLHKMMLQGQDDAGRGIAHFQFNRWCNPEYDHENYALARASAELNYGAAEHDPEFMEQFEGEWTFAEGRVLPFTWMPRPDGLPTNLCGQGEEPEWLPYARTFVSVDYGYSDAAVALFWAIGPEDQLLILDELYERHLEPGDFLRRIKAKESDLGIQPVYYVPDPQQPILTSVMRRDHGFPLFEKMKSSEARDRAAGFGRLRDALAIDPFVGEPKLKVHVRCERTIEEWKQLRFKEGVANEFGHGSLIGADHACDAARYGMMSRPKASRRKVDWTKAFTAAHEEMQWRHRHDARRAPIVEAA